MKTPKSDRDSLKFLIGASVLTLIIWSIPLAFMLVYPLRLFVTFIHEGGHAIAALLSFGSVERIVIFADASGATYTRGGFQLVVASAGYLASTAYGASLLVLCRDGSRAKAVLTVTAAMILALTGLYASDPFSWFTGIILSIGLILIAIAASVRVAHFFLSFLAVQCCLNALFDLRTLFLISATTNTHSDAYTMQQMTLIPAIIWAALWLVISIMALVFALRSHTAR
ncbi:MAG: M50 family metallopeptidase [Acidobacteria bacterium]|nr:M50 family metallopeptidase [Acidobacteriota bacterium]